MEPNVGSKVRITGPSLENSLDGWATGRVGVVLSITEPEIARAASLFDKHAEPHRLFNVQLQDGKGKGLTVEIKPNTFVPRTYPFVLAQLEIVE